MQSQFHVRVVRIPSIGKHALERITKTVDETKDESIMASHSKFGFYPREELMPFDQRLG
jgi:hypothetical protein